MKRLLMILFISLLILTTGCDLFDQFFGKGDPPEQEPSPTSEPPLLLFTSTRNGRLNETIYKINSDGSGLVRMTDPLLSSRDPAWSPDGTRFVYTCNDGSDSELVVMNADGSGETFLTNTPDWEAVPAWSPDGTRIAYRVSGNLAVMNADGTNATVLATMSSGSEFKWSSDGTRFVFSKYVDNWEIFVVDADGNNEAQLTNVAGTDTRPCWSPDGDRIVFTTQRDGSPWELYIMESDGANPSLLTTGEQGGDYAIWSPVEDWIAYKNVDNLELIRPDGTGRIVLTAYDFSGSSSDYSQVWSPDGTLIAFTPYDNGYKQIYIIDKNGSEHFLMENDWDDYQPNWRP